MGYPTQGRIAEDVEYIKQLAVRNGELLREILNILGEKNVSR
jgi:hypothetical protein